MGSFNIICTLFLTVVIYYCIIKNKKSNTENVQPIELENPLSKLNTFIEDRKSVV